MILNVLELTPNKLTTDLTSYNFLLYSTPGVGKTTFALEMFPERSLILGCEFGYKGIPGAIGVPVPNYHTLLQYVDQLDTEEARAQYDTLIVDTTTKVGDMIEEYILSMYGKDTLGECKAHGGAYPFINRYYNLAFNRLKARGYNFVYICHAKTEDIKNEKGEVIGQKYLPKMSDRLNSLIEPEVDYTFFLTLDSKGNRIMATDNTPRSVGKQRTNLPKLMPLDGDKFREEFAKGVHEKAKGSVTDEKVKSTVTEFRSEERDYKEVIAEIKELGKELVNTGKNKDAVAIVNNRLGQDNNGVQRTLDVMTQKNVQMLEAIVLDLKKLMK
ncbi:MAG TPA: hypothetical protein DCW90_06445 [Lachnospiraceae bacterium]|nr:ATP-binding protein [uncultured Lachnoclostridium sp.]HAU85138.1 hypothetical protein [Lachnospiraceae bacterium]